MLSRCRENVAYKASRCSFSPSNGYKSCRAFLYRGIYNRPAHTSILPHHVSNLDEQQPNREKQKEPPIQELVLMIKLGSFLKMVHQ
jgi:hypothetical protein